MSTDDIEFAQALYRVAKDKKTQIKILSQLLNVDTNRICSVLNIHRTKPSVRVWHPPHSSEVKQTVLNRLIKGEQIAVVADEFGIPRVTAGHWAKSIKEQMGITGRWNAQKKEDANG